jgi:hypothetical protein
MSKPVPPAAGPLAVAAHVLLTALVWRDIARRPASELRGSKNLWRFLTALNTGNHLLYLLVGRRRT